MLSGQDSHRSNSDQSRQSHRSMSTHSNSHGQQSHRSTHSNPGDGGSICDSLYDSLSPRSMVSDGCRSVPDGGRGPNLGEVPYTGHPALQHVGASVLAEHRGAPVAGRAMVPAEYHSNTTNGPAQQTAVGRTQPCTTTHSADMQGAGMQGRDAHGMDQDLTNHNQHRTDHSTATLVLEEPLAEEGALTQLGSHQGYAGEEEATGCTGLLHHGAAHGSARQGSTQGTKETLPGLAQHRAWHRLGPQSGAVPSGGAGQREGGGVVGRDGRRPSPGTIEIFEATWDERLLEEVLCLTKPN